MNNDNITLKSLFSFSGCYRRSDFWLANILNFIIMLVIMSAISLIPVQLHDLLENENSLLYFLKGILTLGVLTAYIWITMATIVKRLHDSNHSGWWLLLLLIPYLGMLIIFIVCVFFPSVIGNNRFRNVQVKPSGSDQDSVSVSDNS